MKKTTLAAFILAALTTTFVSCDWFSKKSKNIPPSIVGTWKIDSFHVATNDTVVSMQLYNIARGKDSLSIQFNTDSTFKEIHSKDSLPKKYFVKGKEIFIQEDSTYKSFNFEFKGDSIISLLTKDSTLFVLKRK